MNTINDTSTNGTITGTGTGTALNFNEACGYKLPCGLCRLLMSQCPKEIPYPNIQWTCGTDINPCGGPNE